MCEQVGQVVFFENIVFCVGSFLFLLVLLSLHLFDKDGLVDVFGLPELLMSLHHSVHLSVSLLALLVLFLSGGVAFACLAIHSLAWRHSSLFGLLLRRLAKGALNDLGIFCPADARPTLSPVLTAAAAGGRAFAAVGTIFAHTLVTWLVVALVAPMCLRVVSFAVLVFFIVFVSAHVLNTSFLHLGSYLLLDDVEECDGVQHVRKVKQSVIVIRSHVLLD